MTRIKGNAGFIAPKQTQLPRSTRWFTPQKGSQDCPSHYQGMIRRGRNQCPIGRKRGVVCLLRRSTRRPGGVVPAIYRAGIKPSVAISVPEARLTPMRSRGQSTKRAQRL